MKESLLIFTQRYSPRLDYIVTELFGALGIATELTQDDVVFKSATVPRLNYSDQRFEEVFQMVPHGILFDYRIKDYKLEVHRDATFHFYFFKTSPQGHLPFDLFGAAFWLLSRYEEYLPHTSQDKHKRFHYKSSLAWQNSFLNEPLINYWVNGLIQLLKGKYPSFAVQLPEYQYLNSMDIDSAYRYRYKGFVRTLSGVLHDLSQWNTDQLNDRLAVLFNRKKDPYDVYEQVQTLHREYGVKGIFFFLLGDYGLNDKNHAATNTRFQMLIKYISDYNETGLHPSFKSNFNDNQLKVETARLAQINHKPVTRSRQHFSMLHFPATYSALISAGIESDYSMGYNDIMGFRASYCYPYKWYNLEEEQTTGLMIHPFCINEAAFGFSRLQDATVLLPQIHQVVAQVKQFGGELITVFHNDSFSLYAGKNYRAFYEQVLNLCQNPS